MKQLNTRNFFLALSAITLLATGCNKGDDNGGNGGPSGTNLTALEKMVVGKWQPTSEIFVTYRSSGNNTQNRLQSCETDDVYAFTDDLKYTVSDGSNACVTSGQTYTATFPWNVSADSSFNFTHGPGRYTPKIYHLDNATLKMFSNDVNSTAYATFIRK